MACLNIDVSDPSKLPRNFHTIRDHDDLDFGIGEASALNGFCDDNLKCGTECRILRFDLDLCRHVLLLLNFVRTKIRRSQTPISVLYTNRETGTTTTGRVRDTFYLQWVLADRNQISLGLRPDATYGNDPR